MLVQKDTLFLFSRHHLSPLQRRVWQNIRDIFFTLKVSRTRSLAREVRVPWGRLSF